MLEVVHQFISKHLNLSLVVNYDSKLFSLSDAEIEEEFNKLLAFMRRSRVALDDDE